MILGRKGIRNGGLRMVAKQLGREFSGVSTRAEGPEIRDQPMRWQAHFGAQILGRPTSDSCSANLERFS